MIEAAAMLNESLVLSRLARLRQCLADRQLGPGKREPAIRLTHIARPVLVARPGYSGTVVTGCNRYFLSVAAALGSRYRSKCFSESDGSLREPRGGLFRDETCRLKPIDNPFGPKVLPMSPEWTGAKCHPCLRNTLLPSTQEGHQRVADARGRERRRC